MNIASDPKLSDPKRSDPRVAGESTQLSPDADLATALASATGVLTVDLDAIVANWRKLEKTAVPAECAGVIKADAYGCGIDPVARALAPAARPFSSPRWMKRAPPAPPSRLPRSTCSAASCRTAAMRSPKSTPSR